MLRGPVAAEKSRVSLVLDGFSVMVVVLIPQLSGRLKVPFCAPVILLVPVPPMTSEILVKVEPELTFGAILLPRSTVTVPLKSE